LTIENESNHLIDILRKKNFLTEPTGRHLRIRFPFVSVRSTIDENADPEKENTKEMPCVFFNTNVSFLKKIQK